MADPAIDPTAEQIALITGSSDSGPIVMVNLLRFKPDADGIDAARTEILELSRGRIELAAELGIGGCRERSFG